MFKRQGKIKIAWNPNFAYAIGLLVTDGSLSRDGRHISFTSKDFALIKNLKLGLGITNHVGKKARSNDSEKKYFVLQIGDVLFYRFLISIGLMPNKSKRLRKIIVPDEYFFDFLRGHFDGDGTFYSYWDPRWKSSFMFYTVFTSASQKHIQWLREKINDLLDINGHLNKHHSDSLYQLKYAKTESLITLKRLYNSPKGPCLRRKYLKIMKALSIVLKSEQNARVEKR